MTEQTGSSSKRWLLIAAEIALILIVIGLLVAIWLPAIMGAGEG